MEMLEALNQFRIYCSCCRVEPLHGEFINDAYWVVNSNGKKEDYLLQRINHKIFKDVSVLMKNISSTLNYLYLKEAPIGFNSVNLVETKEGDYYFRDKTGWHWRLFQIPGRRELQEIHNTREGAYEWAGAFGRFLSSIDEFPIQSPGEIVFTHRAVLKKLKNFESVTAPFFIGERDVLRDEMDYVFRWIKRVAVLDRLLEPEYSTMIVDKAKIAKVV